MKAFVLDRYRKDAPLRLGDLPDPINGQNDVLVEVHAAGVNVLDLMIRDGAFRLLVPYRLPVALGHDVAGRVVRVGARVRRFRPGDEVYARPRDGRIGTFAEMIAIDEADVALKPKNLTMEEAASVPLVGLTAWQVLVDKAKVSKGDKVFIQAGSGGVGTIAIQLAKHLGATVATTTSAANKEFVRTLGADVVIDYRAEDFEKVLSAYDLVLNSQDRKTLEKSLRVLKRGGTAVSISGPPEPRFARERGLGVVVRTAARFLSASIRRQAKKAGVDYSFMLMKASGAQLEELTTLVEAGVIRPIVDRVFPFEATNDALDYVRQGRARGKVVIRIR